MLETLTHSEFYWADSGRDDALYVHEWIHQFQRPLESVHELNWDAVLFGVPFSKASISPSGASLFPESFRRSWKSFSTYDGDHETDLTPLNVADLGNVVMHHTDISLCHDNIKNTMIGVRRLFPNSFPIAIGGDHSITAMLVDGLKLWKPAEKWGILQFDTHFDLRDPFEQGPTNGTPIRRLIEKGHVKGENIYNIGIHGFFNNRLLFQYAREQKVNYVTVNEVRKKGIVYAVNKALLDLKSRVDSIYMTVDMDVLDICCAPGVPASTPRGLMIDELLEGVYRAGLSQLVKAMDIVCLDPMRDPITHPTVKAGTYVFLTFLSALKTRRKNSDR